MISILAYLTACLVFFQDPKLQVKTEEIVWPGNQTVQPKGLKISTHLKVVTLEELPFIYAEPVHSPDDCNIKFNKVPCPKPNKTGKINLCLKPLYSIGQAP